LVVSVRTENPAPKNRERLVATFLKLFLRVMLTQTGFETDACFAVDVLRH